MRMVTWQRLVAAIALGALVIRLGGVVRGLGPLGMDTSYDDGVYFTSSAAFWRGVIPYRDFVLVHPPGIVYILGLVSWMKDPGKAFAAGRVLACCAGALSVGLTGVLGKRLAGPTAGVVAAAVIAVHPMAVFWDRITSIEPFLRVACLAFVLVWLGERRSRPLLAGVLAGAACAIKSWGVLWIVAILATAGRDRLRREGPRFAIGFIVSGAALVLPLAVLAPSAFLRQTVRFQLTRPADGMSVPERLLDFVRYDGAGFLALALAITGAAILARRQPERAVAAIFVVVTAALLFGNSYYPSYKAHLAVLVALLAGVVVAEVVAISPDWRMRLIAATLAGGLVVTWATDLPGITKGGGAELQAFRRTVPQYVPADASVFSMDPTWLVVARRLQNLHDDAPVIIDSYGSMLSYAAVDSGSNFRDAVDAFAHSRPQLPLRQRLQHSDYALFGYRSEFLSAADEKWVVSRFECVDPWDGRLCVWRRRAAPRHGLTRLEEGFVRYGAGWIGPEIDGVDQPHFAGPRSVAALPPIDGPNRLQLSFTFLDTLPRPPTVSIWVDDVLLDQFVATDTNMDRSYEVAPGSSVRELRIESSESVVPREVGASLDPRELSFVLNRLRWAPA